jgi:acyl transferase domain-containing protein/NAD(P)-dependent dehydrogenase (short-subunit alcohol dehydrogenase family)/SAM-dependent methyltransferase/acyl carrier protein
MSDFLERIAKLSPNRLALLAAELNTKLQRLEQRAAEPIAVTGFGCRFPGGTNDPDSFWQLLSEGRDALVEVPPSRWDIDALYDPDPDAIGKMNTRWGGFLDRIDQFDPEFFGISPREAASMDPQQRILLEVTWEALENAGENPHRLVGSQTGVFVGLCNSDYFLMQFEAGRSSIDAYRATGNAHSVASGRISYTLGLQGPSVAVDTGCSGSLVAVHLACQSLRAGECRMALAGGVNLILMPDTTIVLSKAHMMSPDGRCKAFDASADGFVRSEGCGLIVLKRLCDAQADGDRILAVIRGSASNQDGRSNGLTAPNGPSQVAVIRQALTNAGIQPGDVDYIEAHGTGTALGDPIEARALADVFGPGRASDCPLRIGSVKTNFGHAESAAGIAGLIKAILAIQHEKIPASLHLKKLNPHIEWSGLPIAVPTTATNWNRERGRRIAGVSSFGFSGTNAHVIVSDLPMGEAISEPVVQDAERFGKIPLQVLPLSAHSESALLELAGRYQQFFDENPRLELADVCHTAAVGRSHFESGRKDVRIRSGRSAKSGTPGVVFMFTGQGSQYPGMGRELFETQPIFRRELEKCAEVLKPLLQISLVELLFAEKNQPSNKEAGHRLHQTQYTQPALFAFEYALAAAWRSWGVEPVAVLGHSVGEYVAACVAGVFSLEDALRLISERARLMGALPSGGAMAAVFADEARVAQALPAKGEQLGIACVNGPANVVVSGSSVAVDALLSELKNTGIRAHFLLVSHAFHSELMDPILDSFYKAATSVRYSEPLLPIFSNVTGKLATPDLMSNPEYWRRQIRNPVRFADSIGALREMGHSVFLEIGPQPILTGMARVTAPETEAVWATSLSRDQENWKTLLNAASNLYVNGVDLDWNSLPTTSKKKRLSLPAYPFERRRFWIQKRNTVARQPRHGSVARDSKCHPFLGERLDSPAITGTVFELQLGSERPAFLDDHRIFEGLLMPSPAYIEMALAGVAEVSNLARSESLCCELTHFQIHEPLFLPEAELCKIQLVVEEDAERGMSFRICSQDLSDGSNGGAQNRWRTHATGNARVGLPLPQVETKIWNRKQVWTRCSQEIDPNLFYDSLNSLGLQFGDRFRGIVNIRRREGEALAEIRLSDSLLSEISSYRIHPALLDSCFHLLGAALPADIAQCAYLLVGLERFNIFSIAPVRFWNHTVLRAASGLNQESFTGDIWLYDDNGGLIAEILGIQIKRAAGDAIARAAGSKAEGWFYQMHWRAQELPAAQMKNNGTGLAEFIPTPASLAEKAGRELYAVAKTEGLSIYEQLIPQFQKLSLRFIIRAFLRLGWSFQSGERFTTSELEKRLAVVPDHRRLLQTLSEEGILMPDAGYWIVRKPLESPAADLQFEADRLKEQFPACSAEITLTARCAHRLDEVLGGTCDPLQLLFPGGDFDTADGLYRHSPFARALNTILRQVVAAAIEKAPQGRVVRILEIGAGTGGTTSFLLPQLSAERTNYVFTDVSPLFLARAREEFRSFQFATYQLLDIEQSPTDQGFKEQSFDVIVAANALHATRDLRQALSHTTSLLAPGGLLVLLEATARQRWIELTFGLTEGWWRFEDVGLRPDCALLAAEKWKALFEEQGLQTIPSTVSSSGSLDLVQQSILIGRKPITISKKGIEKTSRGFWVILSDNHGIGERFADIILERGQECVLVSPGEGYQFGNGIRATVNPLRPEDFQRLFLDAGADRPLDGVLNLWSMDEEIGIETTPARWEAAQQRVAAGVLHAVQAFLALPPDAVSAEARLWLATSGAQSVPPEILELGDDGIHVRSPGCQPIQALAWGIGRVISLEHPNRFGAMVDIDPAMSPQESAVAIRHEIERGGVEDAVAYRSGKRLVPRLGPTEEPELESFSLRRDGSYLVTGGLGGLGLRITEWMAMRGAGQVVLVSRRDFPDRTRWSNLLADDPYREAVQTIIKAEELGTRVTIAKADVADEEAMHQIIDSFANGDSPLRGIVHCAVDMTSRSICDLDLASFQKMCRSKALGAWVLHRLTRAMDLDFFVLFSSTTGLWGARGLGHYAAANQALDVLAHWRREHGLPALSVSWGTWRDMRVATQIDKEQFERAGLHPMPADQALMALERLLLKGGKTNASEVVASIDWDALTALYEARRARPIFAEIRSRRLSDKQRNLSQKPPVAESNVSLELKTAPPARRPDILIAHLCSLLGHVLGFEASRKIDLEQGLFDMGMDSLMALELKGRLERSLGLQLPSTLTFNYPNVRALADYILSEVLKFGSESTPEMTHPIPTVAQTQSDSHPTDDLSEDEIANLLLKRLEQLK